MLYLPIGAAMEVDIEIDGLTNCLVNRSTKEECDTQYRLISKQ